MVNLVIVSSGFIRVYRNTIELAMMCFLMAGFDQ